MGLSKLEGCCRLFVYETEAGPRQPEILFAISVVSVHGLDLFFPLRTNLSFYEW